MKSRFKKDIVKYLLIIAIVLCIISHLFSWGTIKENETEMNIYSWGIQSSNSTSQNIWGTPFNPPSISKIFPNDEINQLGIPFAIWGVPLVSSIVGIIFGIIALISMDNKKRPDLTSEAGLFAILSLIFFYIFVNFGLFSTEIGSALKSDFSWSAGFFIMLLSGILFFVAFFLNKYVIQKG